MKKRLISACAGVLAVGALGSIASAALTIDLRQADTNAKSIAIGAADLNKPITVNVYAQVTGVLSTTGKFETLRSVTGSLVSTGSTLGTIAPAGDIIIDPTDPDATREIQMVGFGDWLGAGAANGKAQDIDGDGDMDLGGKNGGANADWVLFRTDIQKYGTTQGTVIPNGKEFLVGVLTFTPSALGGNTTINFLGRTDETGALTADAGLWTEDGTAAANLRDGSSGQYVVSGFQIIVPEPASMSLLGLGGALLLGRRNRK